MGDSPPTLDEYLSKTPPEHEWIERLARRYRGLSTQQRFDLLADLLKEMDAIVGDRQPRRDEPLPLWSPRESSNRA